VSNIIIVESKNDQLFLESLIQFMAINTEIETRICIDEYKCLEGLSQKRLIDVLKTIKDDSAKINIEKIGIIIDQDQFSYQERLDWLNHCLQQVFNMMMIDTGKFIEIYNDYGDCLNLSCYFMNVDGQGELETVLKIIKNQDSIYADCLEIWKDCLLNHGKTISQKEFDKFWLSNYIRFDTCSKKDRKQADLKCSMKNFDYIMKNKPEIWDFNHPILTDLMEFLKKFS
jgi:hypothetical protein